MFTSGNKMTFLSRFAAREAFTPTRLREKAKLTPSRRILYYFMEVTFEN